MKTKIVSYTLETLPPLTKAQLANLKRSGETRPDSEIDTSYGTRRPRTSSGKTPCGGGSTAR